MTFTARHMFDTVKEARLREFWPTAEPLRVLAREWGCSDAYISQQAKRLGLPGRSKRITEIRRYTYLRRWSHPDEFSYLVECANKRGMRLSDLQVIILRTVVRDKLVDAILDDQPQTQAA